MKADIKSYVKRLRRMHDKELRASKAWQKRDADAIEAEVKRLTRIDCQKLMANPDVRAIIESELSGDDLGQTVGLIIHEGETSAQSDVAGDGAGFDAIIAGIRSSSPDKRKQLLNDPAYLERLGKQIKDPAHYRECLDALMSARQSEDKLGKLDEAVVKGKEDDVMRHLVEMDAEELRRLRSDPMLQAKLLAELDDKQRELARKILMTPLPDVAAPPVQGEKIDAKAAKAKEQKADKQRLEFLTHNAIQRLHWVESAELGWDTLLRQSIEIFNMGFEKEAAAAAPVMDEMGLPGDPAAAKASAADDQRLADAAAVTHRNKVWAGARDAVEKTAERISKDKRKTQSTVYDPKEVIAIVRKAVLHAADPSSERLKENIGSNYKIYLDGGAEIDAQHTTDMDGLKATIKSASPQVLVEEWSTVQKPTISGGPSLKSVYDDYAKQKAISEKEEAAEPKEGGDPQKAQARKNALEDKRLAYMNYAIDISADFEALVLPNVGSDRDRTAQDGGQRKSLAEKDNKKYNELVDAVRERLPGLTKAPHSQHIAKLLKMDPQDALMLDTPNRDALTQYAYRDSKYLRSRGTQAGSGWAADKEAQVVDQAMTRYGHDVAEAQVNAGDKHGIITKQENTKLEDSGQEVERSLQAFKDAKAKVAQWLSLIVGVLVTALLTVATGGLAAGPIGALFWTTAIAGMSATAKALVNEAVLAEDYDFKDEGMKMIGQEMLTAFITAGTTMIASKVVGAVSGASSLARQAHATESVLRMPPPLWKTYLSEFGEGALQEGLSGTVDAGLTAIDPVYWMHGVAEGRDRAYPAAMDKLNAVGPRAMKMGLQSFVTARLLGIGGKGKDLQKATQAAGPGGRVNIKENFKKVFGNQYSKMMNTFVDWTFRHLGESDAKAINLEDVPADLVETYLGQIQNTAMEVHTGSATEASHKAKVKKDLEKHEHLLTKGEKNDFHAMQGRANHNQPYVSVVDYIRVRNQLASDAMFAWQQKTGKPVTETQARSFMEWVRGANNPDDFQARMHSDPTSPAIPQIESKMPEPPAKQDADALDQTNREPKQENHETTTPKKHLDTRAGEVGKVTPETVEVARRSKEAELGHPMTADEKHNFETLANKYGLEEGKRLFDVWQSRRQTKMPSVEDQMKLGHAGIEIHSHFMGNVSSEAFKNQLAKTDAPPMDGQVSEWEPLLAEIIKLKKGLGHTYEQSKTDPTKHEIDPETGLPKIKKRGTSGDAIRQAEQAADEIKQLKEQLQNPALGDKQKADLRHQIEEKAKNAVEKSLRTSDETDFNSSYEIRDELVKKFYGAGERNAMLAREGIAADSTVIESAEAYRKYYDGRPLVQAKINDAVAAQHKINEIAETAKKENRAPTEVEERQVKDLRRKADSLKEQMAYDAYAKDTLRRLAEDNIRYTEQSNSAKKLTERFDPEQLEWLKKQLISELHAEGNKELAQRVRDLTVVHVAMVNTALFGTADENVDSSDTGRRERTNTGDFAKQVKDVVAMTARPDVVAVDIAGAEHYQFDAIGQARFEFLCDKLLQAAIQRNEPLNIRPHVGEGATDVAQGKHYSDKMDRQTKGGELTADVRARKNLDALIESVARLKAKHPEFDKWLSVRFGHATHTTPEQAIKMAKLGIIAEVNLESNAMTGATSPTDHDLSGGDKKRGTDQKPMQHESDPTKRDPKLSGHALPELIYNDVQVVLSTDAHEVMSTDLSNEYTRAATIVDEVLAGSRGVEMTRGQAAALGVHVPEGAGLVVVKITQLKGDHQQAFREKFEAAKRKFFEDANKYYTTQRPKRGNDQTGPDPAAGSAGGRIGGDNDQTHRPAENGPNVEKRAKEVQAKFDAKQRGEWDALIAKAQNPAHKVLMERALAAGHTLDEINVLRLAMYDMTEAEAMREFSGFGVVQFYHQSCVPTAYQIAIAEIDPLFALHLRNHPELVMGAQRDAVRQGGGNPTEREDIRLKRENPNNPDKQQLPDAVQAHLDDPQSRKAMGDQSMYGGGKQGASNTGIEATEMSGQALHQQLEKSTGVKYKVITDDGHNFKKTGDGQFSSTGVPHDQIMAALDQRLPVMFSLHNHEYVIISYAMGADGFPTYTVSDPASGKTSKQPGSIMGMVKTESITLPDLGGGKKSEPAKTAVVDPAKSTKTGTIGDGDKNGVKDENAHETNEAKNLADKHRDAASPEHAKTGEVSKDLPPEPKDGWTKSEEQKQALDGAKTGKPSEDQRELLRNEIRRQVPDVALAEHIQDPSKGGASVVSVVFPGGGPFGIKKMNDDVLGQRFNDALIADRNKVVEAAFRDAHLEVVEQNYKTVTLVSKAPASTLGEAMRSALATIDMMMPEIIAKHLAIAKASYERVIKEANGKENPDTKAAKKHLQEIAALEGSMGEKMKDGFAVEMGAADLQGKDYKSIVEAEMNASKAAIMARDGADSKSTGRAKVYSEEGFVEFVHDTMAIRDGLENKELPVHGKPRRIIVDGKLDREILWAVRKEKLDTLTDEQKGILKQVERYIKRVNSLDYMAPFKGDEIGAQGEKVKAARDAIASLGAENFNADDAAKIDTILRGQVAQQNAASEAQFFNAAAADPHHRLVINADIKDMGLDLWKDLEGSMQGIDAAGRTGSAGREALRTTSASAADKIVERKRLTHERYKTFYDNMLAKAQTLAAGKPDLLKALSHETVPMYLQGGDEITLSISPVFRQLGLEHEFVQFLFDNANARVAITDAHGGTDGHREAMKKADSGHKELKKYEEIRRAIENELKGNRYNQKQRDLAKKLLGDIDSLYTQTNARGETELHGKNVDPDAIRAQASSLLNNDVVSGIMDGKKGS